MNALVEPLALDQQQIEYVISCYAAFQKIEEVLDNFKECFPEFVEQLEKENETWQAELELAVQHLDRAHPKFPEEYKMAFTGMRRNYLAQIEDERLSSPRIRLKEMEKILKELEGPIDDKYLAAVQSVRLDVLKAAREESYAFADAKAGKSGMSQEEIESLLKQLTDEQYAEFKERYANNEHPDLIVMDMLRVVEENAKILPEEKTDDNPA